MDDSIQKVEGTDAFFHEHEEKLNDSRNYYIKGTTFNYKYSHQLSVAITKMQGLTKSIRVSQITNDLIDARHSFICLSDSALQKK